VNTPATITVVILAYFGSAIYPMIYLLQYEVVRTALFGFLKRTAAKMRGQASSSAT